MTSTPHTLRSSYREAILEHLLTGELLRELWCRGIVADVLKAGVDAAGYDLAIQCGGTLRYIQLKASAANATTQQVNINRQLGADDRSGCVIWIRFEGDTLEITSLGWFGGAPGERLDLQQFRNAHHTKGDSTGRKAERPGICVIPRGRFEFFKNDKYRKLLECLFGPVVSRD